jgi:hypothetical protein
MNSDALNLLNTTISTDGETIRKYAKDLDTTGLKAEKEQLNTNMNKILDTAMLLKESVKNGKQS